MISPILLTILIPFIPLVGWGILTILRNRLSEPVAGWMASLCVIVPFVLCCWVFPLIQSGALIAIPVWKWFQVGRLDISLNFLMDPLSVWMGILITGVASLIHIYSIGYMHGDSGFNRFFSYLNLFVFFMLFLVFSDSYLGMFIGWEGVGLCSYLLIGFWYENPMFHAAAKKAFLMNRIGDAGFILGILVLLVLFGTTAFVPIFTYAGQLGSNSPLILLITGLLLIGAIGKSAQFPLYTWLPDAMAGPTPVSALIHAATMVIAGIYMIARSNFLYSLAPLTLDVMLIIGTITAVLGGLIAIGQTDIKKVLAYSTVSQLGIMMIALGLGQYTVALFHMTTHAFFKALLFLGAGSVIHALDGEQDMTRMGGLRKWVPFTGGVMAIGTLAIVGFPPFSGFFSKDAILIAGAQQSWILFALLILISILTAIYMFKLGVMTFLGNSRMDSAKKPHESPWVMRGPLGVLAVFSAIGGVVNLPFGNGREWLTRYLRPVVQDAPVTITGANSHSLEWALIVGTITVLGVLFIVIYRAYCKNPLTFIPNINRQMGLDKVYTILIIKPYEALSTFLSNTVDRRLISGGIAQLAGAVTVTGRILKYTQTGNAGTYMLFMVAGIVILIAAVVWGI